MVMKRNVMGKNLRQTIKKSLGRYIAIVAIIALGAGMFVGLLTTKSDMVATTQAFTDDMNMFHLLLLNTYGWTAEDVDAVAKLDGVACAEGVITIDALGHFGDSTKDSAYRLHAIPEKISKIELLGGRMPTSPDECLMDGSHADDSVLGTTFTISPSNTGTTLESLSHHTFTVVGYVTTPLYMDISRGTTTIGNGSLSSYLYLQPDAFTVDYFTEIAVTMPGSYEIYSEALNTAMEDFANQLEPHVTILAQNRYETVRIEATDDFVDGVKQYNNGRTQYFANRFKAYTSMDAALQKIKDGQAEIDSNAATLADAEQELLDGQAELDANAALLSQSRQELLNGKTETYNQLAAAEAELAKNKAEVLSGLAQVESGLSQINSGISQLEAGLTELAGGLEQLNTLIDLLQTGVDLAEELLEIAKNNPLNSSQIISEMEAKLDKQRTELQSYIDQRDQLTASQLEYSGQLEALKTQRSELEATKATLDEAKLAIELGYIELNSGKAQAELEFASAEAELDAAQLQLEQGRTELEAGWAELESGKAALEDAQKQLDEGKASYEAGKIDAEQKLSEARIELLDAKAELLSAHETIDKMEQPQVYLLDRNTNTGYAAVDSNSDIVAAVSRVFPAFFLLVAALVCITTMTRMVEEERTQIGILKALGYTNRAIISKYLIYTCSAAILGCGLGVVIGSVVFPTILWAGYSIIITVRPDIVLQLDWPLCIAVVAAYTAVSALVTWYCCRRSLREVPAELMRPKAPTAGKKILLEHLPFWHRISFLNKVMFRNVFRYRQRLLMMLVGIGGCTALLLTGFGFRDSIIDIVDHQFAEITPYDMSVYFSEAQTQSQQNRFREDLRNDVDDILFLYANSAELSFDDTTKEVQLIASDAHLTDFFKMERNGKPLNMPGEGEACITIGVAENMGIQTGDTITVRDPQMRLLELKVAGIFTNYVDNYVITCPETIQNQWGEVPGYQMALITVGDGQDAHAAGAKISGMNQVLNVSISQDIANQVGSMLEALDTIVVTIVICAGLLAAIVLYNLTNISITERIREIATIKVLGFNSKESALYVFKENLLLSTMGAGIGLIGGIYLLKFVMSQIRIDLVWFTDRLTFWSFLWAVVLTMVCACIVDFFLYFKLEKINMAEALKSVE